LFAFLLGLLHSLIKVGVWSKRPFGAVYRAVLLCADFEPRSDAVTMGDDGGGGMGAYWLRCFGFVAGLEAPVLIGKELPCRSVGRRSPLGADLDEAGVSCGLSGNQGCYLAAVAGNVEALCGIWATGKYFLLARRRSSA